VKSKELIRKLKQAGAVVVKGRGRGSHYLVSVGAFKATVPYHSADLGRYFCMRICEQLGLDPKEVL